MDSLMKIVPVPQYVKRGQNSVKLGTVGKSDVKIIAELECNEFLTEALKRLEDGLFAKIGDEVNKQYAQTEVVLRISTEVPPEIKANYQQAYKIEVGNGRITLTGYGEAGLNYAIISLLQAIDEKNGLFFVPECVIIDWPELKTRGHFMECRYGSNLMQYKDWTALVDDMAKMKMNQLVVALYGCWCVQFDGVISEYLYVPVKKYPKLETKVISKYYSPLNDAWIQRVESVPMAKEDFFGELIAYGKKQGVEIFPLWNSYGHNTLIPRMYPEISARNDGKTTGFGFCVSEEKTYEMLFDILDGIISSYLRPNGITSFHVGLDEVFGFIGTDLSDLHKVNSPWCECEACSKLTNQEKYLKHAIKIISFLKYKGMENVYIYSDMMTTIIDPVRFKDILQENDLLDVVVIDWWSYTNHKEKSMFKTMHPELGMRSTVKPWNSYCHWSMVFSTVPNVRDIVEFAREEKGKTEGIQSYSAWDKSCDRNHVSMAEYSWNFDGNGSVQDFNKRYALREFGSEFEKAYRALCLMDLITEEDGPRETDEKAKLTLLWYKLAYYQYSYVDREKEYPRNFPGEAMSILLEKRDVYEKSLLEISSMAREALTIFEELSENNSCNTKLCRRFACESENYLCLSEDYIALLKIHDLLRNEKMSAEIAERIAILAAKRKNARYALMRRIETVKEEFLIPSHLRIQSIFMQMFADIESYVNSTEPDDIKIDVRNMNNLMSERFFSLR